MVGVALSPAEKLSEMFIEVDGGYLQRRVAGVCYNSRVKENTCGTTAEDDSCCTTTDDDSCCTTADDDSCLQDDEQSIVDFICRHAVCGKRGRMSSKASERRVLLIGKPYYWDHPATISIGELPSCFHRFMSLHGLESFNSILCNVYDQKISRIGAHQDDVSVLAKGEVVSLSLAQNAQDRYKRLAMMCFTSPKGVERVQLRHGMDHAVCFDAIEDKINDRSHEVSSTLVPRVNLTFRHLN